MKNPPVTIKDIARELNISPSTVSRALKDHPDISKETKKAVSELAAKLNYQPNLIALSLRKSKTNTIGVIIPEIVHFFFSTIISGIEDVAYKAGYNVIISQTNESFLREVSDTNALVNSRVDGILASVSKETVSYDHFKNLIDRGIPLVFFDRVCEELNTSRVIVDDYDGAFQATEHLISIGCKTIVHLEGPKNLDITKNRRDGYLAALKKNNLPINEDLIIHCEQTTFDEGSRQIATLFDKKLTFDGIFANNDMVGIGAMIALRDKGVSVPKDVAIVGFSDWEISSLMQPSLSTVSQPGFEMGQKAAQLFIEQSEADEDEFVPRTEVLKTKLIIRKSSMR
ncbi:MAG: LacI family DNA-binding transcriptional regulator [Imperialibacter sp.]|uniref:LacI family DNA-binding transcriptional regulator n=1 Tax=Imperialibacter sp. TaxID=2038411 RepID=UPI0032EFBD2C